MDQQKIIDAFAKRRTPAQAVTELRRVATGLLRRVKSGGTDPVSAALRDLLGVDEEAECAQRVVDWYRDGHADNPPFPQRPAVRGAMGPLLEGLLGRPATSEEVEALVDTVAGAERDLVMVSSPMKRMAIVATLADAFAIGV